jgi:hypothetical protein
VLVLTSCHTGAHSAGGVLLAAGIAFWLLEIEQARLTTGSTLLVLHTGMTSALLVFLYKAVVRSNGWQSSTLQTRVRSTSDATWRGMRISDHQRGYYLHCCSEVFLLH